MSKKKKFEAPTFEGGVVDLTNYNNFHNLFENFEKVCGGKVREQYDSLARPEKRKFVQDWMNALDKFLKKEQQTLNDFYEIRKEFNSLASDEDKEFVESRLLMKDFHNASSFMDVIVNPVEVEETIIEQTATNEEVVEETIKPEVNELEENEMNTNKLEVLMATFGKVTLPECVEYVNSLTPEVAEKHIEIYLGMLEVFLNTTGTSEEDFINSIRESDESRTKVAELLNEFKFVAVMELCAPKEPVKTPAPEDEVVYKEDTRLSNALMSSILPAVTAAVGGYLKGNKLSTTACNTAGAALLGGSVGYMTDNAVLGTVAGTVGGVVGLYFGKSGSGTEVQIEEVQTELVPEPNMSTL